MRGTSLRQANADGVDNARIRRTIAVLDRMIAQRDELARLVGFASWADYITADKMVGARQTRRPSSTGSSRHRARPPRRSTSDSCDRSSRTIRPPRPSTPGSRDITAELVRKAELRFRFAAGPAVLPLRRVKQGLLDVSSRLFGVTFRRVTDAPVWDPSVEALRDARGRTAGRPLLSRHAPAPGEVPARRAIRDPARDSGGRSPEAALICNLPGGKPGDPGLMTHEDVVTFFHEFGHLLHALLGGRQRWVGISGVTHGAGLRRGAVADARGVDLGSRRARDVRATLPDPPADPGRSSSSRCGARTSSAGRSTCGSRWPTRVSRFFYDRPPAQVNADSIVRP